MVEFRENSPSVPHGNSSNFYRVVTKRVGVVHNSSRFQKKTSPNNICSCDRRYKPYSFLSGVRLRTTRYVGTDVKTNDMEASVLDTLRLGLTSSGLSHYFRAVLPDVNDHCSAVFSLLPLLPSLSFPDVLTTPASPSAELLYNPQ